MSSEPFALLYVRSQLHALERQFALPEIVHGDWVFDMAKHSVVFTHGDESRTVPVQILGTESEVSGTWLWAWGNGQSQIPSEMLRDCQLLQGFGDKHGIPELTEPSFDSDVANGHQIAMVAVSLLGAPAYYRCPYEGGAMFVILADPSFNPPPERPFLRMTSALGTILDAMEIIKPRWAMKSWFHHYEAEVEEVGDTLIATHSNGDVLTVEFDAADRIVGLKASLGGDGEVAEA